MSGGIPVLQKMTELFELSLLIQKSLVRNTRSVEYRFRPMSDHRQKLNYLHLMNKSAESGDQQGYFHYLMKAEKAARNEGRKTELFGLTSPDADLNI